jgi:hypothetical protein
MADDLRALLAGLPTASLRTTPRGHVAILRAAAIEAGADGDALDAWVRENGGRVRKAPPIRSSGMRAGRVTAQTQPGEAYYVVPAALLAAKDT